jgi:hypothetical protein
MRLRDGTRSDAGDAGALAATEGGLRGPPRLGSGEFGRVLSEVEDWRI